MAYQCQTFDADDAGNPAPGLMTVRISADGAAYDGSHADLTEAQFLAAQAWVAGRAAQAEAARIAEEARIAAEDAARAEAARLAAIAAEAARVAPVVVDVDSYEALQAALTAAAPLPDGRTHVIRVAPGVYGDPYSGRERVLTARAYPGSLVDPNEGLGIDERDLEAVAALTGGVVITAQVPGTVQLAERIVITGAGNLAVDALAFTAQSPRDNGEGVREFEADSWSQLQFQKKAGRVAVRGCTFGGTLIEAPIARYIGAVRGADILEDCLLDGFTYGTYAGRNEVIRRNALRRQCIDAIRVGFGIKEPCQVLIYGNVILDPITSAPWAGQHRDGTQVGATTTAPEATITIDYHDNVIYGAGYFQGLYMDDTPGLIVPRIKRVLMVTTHAQGVNLWNADRAEVSDLTVVYRGNGEAPPSSPPGIVFFIPSVKGPCAVANCIGVRFNLGSKLIGAAGNIMLPVTTAAYRAQFPNGDFGDGPYPIDKPLTGTPAEVRAALLQRYASADPTKGFEGRTTVFPRIAAFDPITLVAAGSRVETPAQAIAWGQDLEVVPDPGVEVRVLDAGGTIRRDWGGAVAASRGDRIQWGGQAPAGDLAAGSIGGTVGTEASRVVIRTGIRPPDRYLTIPATGSCFLRAPAVPGPDVYKVAFGLTWRSPEPLRGQATLLSQESTACDVRAATAVPGAASEGALWCRIEDGTGAILATGDLLDPDGRRVKPEGGAWHRTEGYVDVRARTATVVHDGVAIDIPIPDGAGNGRLQAARRFALLAFASGLNGMRGCDVADAWIKVGDDPRIDLPNDPASANAHPWKAGTEAFR